MAGTDLLQFRQRCRYGSHNPLICLTIVAIYNASIPGRMATADTAAGDRRAARALVPRFRPDHASLVGLLRCKTGRRSTAGFRVRSFYGRPAYQATVELGVYVAPHGAAPRRRADAARPRARAGAGASRRARCSRSCSATTRRRSRCSSAPASSAWGRLPRVAELDGVERDLVILGLRAA